MSPCMWKSAWSHALVARHMLYVSLEYNHTCMYTHNNLYINCAGTCVRGPATHHVGACMRARAYSCTHAHTCTQFLPIISIFLTLTRMHGFVLMRTHVRERTYACAWVYACAHEYVICESNYFNTLNVMWLCPNVNTLMLMFNQAHWNCYYAVHIYFTCLLKCKVHAYMLVHTHICITVCVCTGTCVTRATYVITVMLNILTKYM